MAGAVLGDVPLKICNMTCTWVRHTYEGGVWPRFRPALFCLVVDGRVRGTKARTMIGPWKGQAQLPRPDRERRGGGGRKKHNSEFCGVARRVAWLRLVGATANVHVRANNQRRSATSTLGLRKDTNYNEMRKYSVSTATHKVRCVSFRGEAADVANMREGRITKRDWRSLRSSTCCGCQPLPSGRKKLAARGCISRCRLPPTPCRLSDGY